MFIIFQESTAYQDEKGIKSQLLVLVLVQRSWSAPTQLA
jgi:hypothetical protein